MGGIQGRLYQQFALTIAISVLISAFNALTLSPALARCCCGRAGKRRRLLGRFFGGFNRGFERATDGYVSVSHGLDPQGAHRHRAARWLFAGVRRRARAGGCRRASCRTRTRATSSSTCSCRRRRRSSAPTPCAGRSTSILAHTEGVANYNTIAGFSCFTRVTASYNGFYFVSSSRGTSARRRRSTARAIVNRLNGELAGHPRGRGVRRRAAGDPRHRHAGRLLVLLQDRSGGIDRVPRRERAEVPRRGAQAARAGRRDVATSRRRCRSSSPTSTATRR